MGKSKPPAPPDPVKTAAAQTSTNVGTSVANAYLGNVNQVTPYGSLDYSKTGTYQWKDPTTGKTYDIPTFTATQTLDPAQQAILDQSNLANLNLATLGAEQTGRLNDVLGTPFSLAGAPAAADPSKLGLPQYLNYTGGPNLQTGLANAGSIANTFGDAGDITRSYDIDFDTTRYEDALMSRLNPQLDRDRAALESRLVNQGLQPGSEAYNRAIDEASRTSTDARMQAILAAGQEQSRLANLAQGLAGFQNAAQQQAYEQLFGRAGFQNAAQAQQFGQNLAGGQFGNQALQDMYNNQFRATSAQNALADQTFNAQQAKMAAENAARQQYIQEQYALRNQPINEISSLLSGAQVTNPNFINPNTYSIPTVDYAGLVNENYNQQMNAYQMQQAQQQALGGGLLGMFGNIIGLSDRRAKKDIKKVGGLYSYRYKGESRKAPKHIGVMAQEVEKVLPDAVIDGADGLKRVNYGMLYAAGVGK